MRKRILTGLLILFSIGLNAQSKWYFEPTTGVSYTYLDGKYRTSTDFRLTIGYALGKNSPYRADMRFGYMTFSDYDNVFTTALLGTYAKEFTKSRKVLFSASAGAGLKKVENDKNFSAFIPVAVKTGYRVTNNFSVGAQASMDHDLSSGGKGSSYFAGLFIGAGL